jgi:DNA-binding XRE family transcriptional regulator
MSLRVVKKCAKNAPGAVLERRKQVMERMAAERVNIPERLVNYRKRLDLTQEEAAKRLGLPLGTYSLTKRDVAVGG